MFQASALRVGQRCVAFLLLALSLLCTVSGHARGTVDAAEQAVVALSELPRQGQETYRLILVGGPFPYEKDGSTFGNRERLLPLKPRGFYREYTVRTPGSRDRGARRIVCGGPPRTPEACYYTQDHYANFRRIVEER